MPISHDAFRQLPPHQAHKYLRDLLTAVGVLEPYEPLLDGMQPWLEEKLVQVPASQAEIIRRYAHWKVIRHMIKLHEQGRLTASATNAARNRITAAIAMLDYFHRHDATAATATQALVERYVARRTAFASLEYTFVTWLRTTRINPGIRLPTPPDGPPNLTLGHEDRWRQIGLLLNDSTLLPWIRVSGLFVVLFALPLVRTLMMRTDQVTLAPDGRVLVTFGEVPIEMPPGVDDLVRNLLANGSTHSYTRTGTHWLFPGRIAGRAMAATALRAQLYPLGIKSRASRQAALFQLAGEVPAPVLAELIGITPGTAATWAALSARDWSGYIAER